jgi:hypothetical protein
MVASRAVDDGLRSTPSISDVTPAGKERRRAAIGLPDR